MTAEHLSTVSNGFLSTCEAFERLVQITSETLQQSPGQKGYILLNPNEGALFENMDLAAMGCEQFPIPVNDKRFLTRPAPALLQWHPHAVEAMRHSIALAWNEFKTVAHELQHGCTIGGWLLSSATGSALARHFASIMSLIRPPTGPHYLRWADRRVFETMWPHLDLAQQQNLLGPVDTWLLLNRNQELVPYEASRRTTVASTLVASTFRLTSDQWLIADLVPVVQQVIRGWRLSLSHLPRDYLQQAAEAIRQAQATGAEKLSDVVLLSVYILQIHPDLCRHPTVRGIVARAHDTPSSLAATLSSITEDAWNNIKADLEQETISPPETEH